MIARGMATPRRRTLAKAAETLGGEQALAEVLGVNVYALAVETCARFARPSAATKPESDAERVLGTEIIVVTPIRDYFFRPSL